MGRQELSKRGTLHRIGVNCPLPLFIFFINNLNILRVYDTRIQYFSCLFSMFKIDRFFIGRKIVFRWFCHTSGSILFVS